MRVSPDHGPVFDIAKCNSAKIDSVVSSIKFLEKHANVKLLSQKITWTKFS